jgi:murein DD-endopeptidase MepM/ murein hydrolase activator NlpD
MRTEEICRAPGAPRLLVLLAVFSLAGGVSWAQARGLTPDQIERRLVAQPQVTLPDVNAVLSAGLPRTVVWRGLDVDGDGQDDFANPTGQAPRLHDSYGDGEFGARRDGGERRHEGVDYAADPGQPVEAPMSGYVTRIGYAYPGDTRYEYVEIDNPALGYSTRVFYVDPQVREGQAVRMGQSIGTAHSLQPRYPGITDHVHLEIARANGRRLDAERLIVASYQPAAPAGSGPRVAVR